MILEVDPKKIISKVTFIVSDYIMMLGFVSVNKAAYS